MTRRRSAGLLAAHNRPVALALIGTVALASYNNLSVTAALPDIGKDLGRVALLNWVVTAELFASAIAVLVVGPFIDGAGARRAFRLTVFAFTASSAMCAAAPTMEVLVAVRVLQGFAAGALIGTAITCVGLAFDEELRPTVYALVSSVWGFMGFGGPAVAATLVSSLGWRAVFAVNLPVAVVAAAFGWRRLPSQPEATASPLDRRGLLIVTAGTIALLLATSAVRWHAVALLVAAAVMAAAYRRHALTATSPLMRIEHMVGRRWLRIHLVATLAILGSTGVIVYLPLYLRGSRGASISFAAFSVLWPTIGWTTAAWVSSILQRRLRAHSVVALGALVITSATASVAVMAAQRVAVPMMLAGFFAVGWGIGTITTASLTILQSRADAHEMGRVSAAHQFLRALGFAYGANIASLVLFWVVGRRTGDVETVRGLLDEADAVIDATAEAALASGYAWALVVAASIAALTVPAAISLARSYDLDLTSRDSGGR